MQQVHGILESFMSSVNFLIITIVYLFTDSGLLSVLFANSLHQPCRCEKRAQDLQLPHLFVFARLALAQFALEHQTCSNQHPGSKPTPQLSGSSQGKNFGDERSVRSAVAQEVGSRVGPTWPTGGGGGDYPS